MDIVYSVALLGLAVVIFIAFLLNDRASDRPGLTSEGMASDLSTVAITGLIAFGLCFGVRFFASANGPAMGLKEVALLAATLTAYYLIYRKLAPRRRIGEYADRHAQGRAISELSSVDIVTVASPADNSDQPVKPGLSRAA